jgi:hypothetical protein
MDNIHLTPFEDTSKPFDFDAVYQEGRERIYSSVNVTGQIQMIEVGNTNEPLFVIEPSTAPYYELPGQQYQYTPRIMTIPIQENESVRQTQEDIINMNPPKINEEYEPTEDDMKEARKLMFKKVQSIEIYIGSLVLSVASKRFLLGCIRVENKGKKRKSVLDMLEEKFLAIIPEGE